MFTNVKCQTTDKTAALAIKQAKSIACRLEMLNAIHEKHFTQFVISFHHVFLENIFMMTER